MGDDGSVMVDMMLCVGFCYARFTFPFYLTAVVVLQHKKVIETFTLHIEHQKQIQK